MIHITNTYGQWKHCSIDNVYFSFISKDKVEIEYCMTTTQLKQLIEFIENYDKTYPPDQVSELWIDKNDENPKT
jgi:hypothetical protein